MKGILSVIIGIVLTTIILPMLLPIDAENTHRLQYWLFCKRSKYDYDYYYDHDHDHDYN